MGKIRRYVFALLALTAGVFEVRAAETLAHWTFGEHGLSDISGNGRRGLRGHGFHRSLGYGG